MLSAQIRTLERVCLRFTHLLKILLLILLGLCIPLLLYRFACCILQSVFHVGLISADLVLGCNKVEIYNTDMVLLKEPKREHFITLIASKYQFASVGIYNMVRIPCFGSFKKRVDVIYGDLVLH